MTFFFSLEGQTPASNYVSHIQKVFGPALNEILKDKNYGEELIHIGIISMVLRKSFYESFDFPERRLFQRKQKSADLRLRVDFEKFMDSTHEERVRMYIQHVIDSIETLRHKVSKSYKFNELIQDVLEVLESCEVTKPVSKYFAY